MHPRGWARRAHDGLLDRHCRLVGVVDHPWALAPRVTPSATCVRLDAGRTWRLQVPTRLVATKTLQSPTGVDVSEILRRAIPPQAFLRPTATRRMLLKLACARTKHIEQRHCFDQVAVGSRPRLCPRPYCLTFPRTLDHADTPACALSNPLCANVRVPRGLRLASWCMYDSMRKSCSSMAKIMPLTRVCSLRTLPHLAPPLNTRGRTFWNLRIFQFALRTCSPL